MNLCLFCVEKKGWSDTFATQSSYNQHYKENHEGIIENKGQLISDCPLGVIDFPKNQRNIWQVSALESKKWSNQQNKSTFL